MTIAENLEKQTTERMLRRLLVLRFGTLAADIEARIAQASMHQLETWIERVVTTSSLDEVFAGT